MCSGIVEHRFRNLLSHELVENAFDASPNISIGQLSASGTEIVDHMLGPGRSRDSRT
jgi:hypothetical protein